MITREIKGLLFQKAIKKTGKIFPCDDVTFEESFEELKGRVYFLYNDVRGSTHATCYDRMKDELI